MSTVSFAKVKMKTGMWQGELAMNDRLFIPFQLNVEKEGKKIFVVNDLEEILMISHSKKDSIYLHFPIQDAEVIFKLEQNGESARGYWINYNKRINKNKNHKFNKQIASINQQIIHKL